MDKPQITVNNSGFSDAVFLFLVFLAFLFCLAWFVILPVTGLLFLLGFLE